MPKLVYEKFSAIDFTHQKDQAKNKKSENYATSLTITNSKTFTQDA